MNNKKVAMISIMGIILTMMFFSYRVAITYDTASYIWLSTLLFDSQAFQTWDVARGPIFPLFIRICNVFFGRSTNGLLVGMFLFYIIMILSCYLIYKYSIKDEPFLNKKMKVALFILFFITIVINPMIFGFFHILLTEFIAITLAIVGCFIAWKWLDVSFYEKKLLYIIYTLILALLTAIAWLLKQPYVGTIFFPIIVSAVISFIRETNLKNFIQRVVTIIICIITLIIGIKTWGAIIHFCKVEIDENRTSSSYLASGIVNGIKAYDTEPIRDFDTEEEVSKCNKFSNEDKERIISIIKGESEFKSYRVIDVKKEKYEVLFLKKDAMSTSEALRFWLKNLIHNPGIIIESYFSNYLATITVYPIEFQGSRIIITKSFDFYNTAEIGIITEKVFLYGCDSVFYLPEEYEQFVEKYHGINEPIIPINFIMEKLEIPENIIMKITYLLLPLLTLISIIAVFYSKNRYNMKFCRIVDIITILFTYSIMHILVHSLMGSTIDRYTIPALPTSYLGILLSIYAIRNSNKYKIKSEKEKRK